jgi:hypothetical protein
MEGELERVRQEVEYDLLPHVAVDVGVLREGGAVDDQLHAGALDGRAEDCRELLGELAEVGGLEHGVSLARL